MLASGCEQHPAPLFARIAAADSGLTFANRVTENDTFNILDFEYVYNGGGVGAGDFNGDGLTDLYFTGNTTGNRLFLNLDNFKFLDVTESTAVGGASRWCSGVSLADVNGDGLLDIYVSATTYEPGPRRANLLYLNAGNTSEEGKNPLPIFREVAQPCGLADTSHTTQTVFFDYDCDGDLDAYLLVNEMDDRSIPNRYLPKKNDGSSPRNDRFYRNDGLGPDGLPHFVIATHEAGILTEGYGLGIRVCDPNDDGWPDLYITNDYLSNDLLWVNNQDGTFTDRAAEYFKHTAYSAMGNDVADMNNDGQDDFIAVDMYPENNLRRKAMLPPNNYTSVINNERFGYLPQYTRNILQLHRGKVPGTDQLIFSEVGMQAGIAASDWSWSPLAADFDHDGDRDLIITNGFPRDVTDRDFMDYNVVMSRIADRETRLAQIPSVKIANYVYENDGGSVPVFTKRTAEWGMAIPSFSNGAVFADLDNDGDLDYVVNNINDSCFLFRNELAETDSNAWLNIHLRGDGANTRALGARVNVYLTDGRLQTAYHHPTRGFLSSVADDLHFGFGPRDKAVYLTVRWPDGQKSRHEIPEINKVLKIIQGSGKALVNAPLASNNSDLLRADSSASKIFLRHRDSLFIDFNVQPLLPHKLSEYGPGLAVGDVNGDGLDDIFRTGSHFYTGELRLQTQTGKFINAPNIGDAPEKEGLGSLFFDADQDGDQDLYIVNGGSEFASDRAELLDQLFLNDGNGNFTETVDALPALYSSGSCVRAADVDRDGDLDLFVGGRLQPAAFPKAVDSYLLLNNGQGKFMPAEVSDFVGFGMVCDALWTDCNSDGWIDLLVALQGQGLRLLTNSEGHLTDATPAIFHEKVGWWNGLAAADFDRDGDIDYVAGNFGHNHLYRQNEQDYVGLHGADFDRNGGYDLLVSDLALAEDGTYQDFPHAQRLDTEKQLISIKKLFERHSIFGRVTIDDLIANYPDAEVTALRANYLSSAWIENLGEEEFTFHSLPREAQVSPIFGIQAIGLNDDVYPDLVMIGNEYGAETGMGQMDALNGLALIFDPELSDFRVAPREDHGFYVPGNGRSLTHVHTAASSLLFAGENQGQTRAFNAEPIGSLLKVGPAVQRVTFLLGGQSTTAEVYYGSGFLSQSSRMVWLPPDAKEVRTIDFVGEIIEVSGF